MDFYHYKVVVYTYCQHAFKFKQHVKVNFASNDPFNQILSIKFTKRPTLINNNAESSITLRIKVKSHIKKVLRFRLVREEGQGFNIVQSR